MRRPRPRWRPERPVGQAKGPRQAGAPGPGRGPGATMMSSAHTTHRPSSRRCHAPAQLSPRRLPGPRRRARPPRRPSTSRRPTSSNTWNRCWAPTATPRHRIRAATSCATSSSPATCPWRGVSPPATPTAANHSKTSCRSPASDCSWQSPDTNPTPAATSWLTPYPPSPERSADTSETRPGRCGYRGESKTSAWRSTTPWRNCHSDTAARRGPARSPPRWALHRRNTRSPASRRRLPRRIPRRDARRRHRPSPRHPRRTRPGP